MNRKPRFNRRPNVTLKNKINSETIACDIIDEQSIDGKMYWSIIRRGRTESFLCAKDYWTVTKG